LRVKKVAGAATTRYIFSGTKVVAEYVNGAAVGSPTKEYIYSGSALLATIEGSNTTYHHQDHLSVRVNTDAQGTKIGEQGNYPFGEFWYSSSTTTKWRFTSYERDAESGNDYAIFRYHSNRLGRFLTPDPLAGSTQNPQSLNRYFYSGNDPANRIDPSGLISLLNGDPFWMLFSAETPGSFFRGGGAAIMDWLNDFRLFREQDEIEQAYSEHVERIDALFIENYINNNGLSFSEAQQFAGMLGYTLTSTVILTPDHSVQTALLPSGEGGDRVEVGGHVNYTATTVWQVVRNPSQLPLAVQFFIPFTLLPVSPGGSIQLFRIPLANGGALYCAGGGLGGGTPTKAVQGGPLAGSPEEIEEVVSGFGWSGGVQLHPLLGAQEFWNTDAGVTGGPTAGTTGASLTYGANGCFQLPW
jgi:RHS repeat-associated protein